MLHAFKKFQHIYAHPSAGHSYICMYVCMSYLSHISLWLCHQFNTKEMKYKCYKEFLMMPMKKMWSGVEWNGKEGKINHVKQNFSSFLFCIHKFVLAAILQQFDSSDFKHWNFRYNEMKLLCIKFIKFQICLFCHGMQMCHTSIMCEDGLQSLCVFTAFS